MDAGRLDMHRADASAASASSDGRNAFVLPDCRVPSSYQFLSRARFVSIVYCWTAARTDAFRRGSGADTPKNAAAAIGHGMSFGHWPTGVGSSSGRWAASCGCGPTCYFYFFLGCAYVILNVERAIWTHTGDTLRHPAYPVLGNKSILKI